jgi:hypothetical protein
MTSDKLKYPDSRGASRIYRDGATSIRAIAGGT